MAQNGLTPEQADRLLERLAEDMGFRERFHSRPVEALSELGIDTEPGLWNCMQARPLPEQQVFREARAKFRQQLLAASGYVIFKIES